VTEYLSTDLRFPLYTQQTAGPRYQIEKDITISGYLATYNDYTPSRSLLGMKPILHEYERGMSQKDHIKVPYTPEQGLDGLR